MYTPTVTVKVDNIRVRQNEVLTVYCQPSYDEPNIGKQIEIRVTSQGMIEIFHHPSESIAIKDFNDWYDANG